MAICEIFHFFPYLTISKQIPGIVFIEKKFSNFQLCPGSCEINAARTHAFSTPLLSFYFFVYRENN